MTKLVIMKSTSATKLKASLRAWLSYVKAGSRLLITEHDIPIAIIYPYAARVLCCRTYDCRA